MSQHQILLLKKDVNKDDSEWTILNRRESKNNNKNNYRNTNSIMDVQHSPSNKFKYVSRTIDLYIDNVYKEVIDEDITNHVINNFDINPIKVVELKIKAIDYKAFKLTIKSNDRDILLNPDKWPSGIVIKKIIIKIYKSLCNFYLFLYFPIHYYI